MQRRSRSIVEAEQRRSYSVFTPYIPRIYPVYTPYEKVSRRHQEGCMGVHRSAQEPMVILLLFLERNGEIVAEYTKGRLRGLLCAL